MKTLFISLLLIVTCSLQAQNTIKLKSIQQAGHQLVVKLPDTTQAEAYLVTVAGPTGDRDLYFLVDTPPTNGFDSLGISLPDEFVIREALYLVTIQIRPGSDMYYGFLTFVFYFILKIIRSFIIKSN